MVELSKEERDRYPKEDAFLVFMNFHDCVTNEFMRVDRHVNKGRVWTLDDERGDFLKKGEAILYLHNMSFEKKPTLRQVHEALDMIRVYLILHPEVEYVMTLTWLSDFVAGLGMHRSKVPVANATLNSEIGEINRQRKELLAHNAWGEFGSLDFKLENLAYWYCRAEEFVLPTERLSEGKKKKPSVILVDERQSVEENRAVYLIYKCIEGLVNQDNVRACFEIWGGDEAKRDLRGITDPVERINWGLKDLLVRAESNDADAGTTIDAALRRIKGLKVGTPVTVLGEHKRYLTSWLILIEK